MYTAAYFEDRDVQAVIEAGLACIPKESQYHQCISDVLRWHDEQPEDWLATWHLVEAKWQDDVDCMPGDPFNIDAKLNGAYVVMGLLYGEGDMMRTMEVATRCGQDADCNPSNAAGVLGCMKGYERLGPELVGGLPAIEDQAFIHTDYCFKTLPAACQRIAEQVIRRAGGTVEEKAYVIARQAPGAPAELEQWTDQMAILSCPILPGEMKRWNPAWSVLACGHDMEPGLRAEQFGRENVLVLHPVSQDAPAAIEGALGVPTGAKRLAIEVASDPRGDFLLRVFLNDQLAKEKHIDTQGRWTTVEVDLTPHAGKTVTVRVENCANGWRFEAGYFDSILIL